MAAFGAGHSFFAGMRDWATAAGLVAALMAGGCAVSGGPKLTMTGTNVQPPQSAAEAAPIPPEQKAAAEKQARRAAALAKAESDPKDAGQTIAAARGLRSEKRLDDALRLVERSLAVNPRDSALHRELGLLALDSGRLAPAEKHLKTALELGAADWQTRSALGAALAAQGKHPAAQQHLAKALELRPDHPSVLNNLALSYALDGKPEEAERVLRIAADAKGAPAHVRQNLAIVLGISGKLPEAQKVASASLPPERATANAAYLTSLAQTRAETLEPVAAATAPAPALSPVVKSARAPVDMEKPYLLGVGAPKTSP